MMTDNQPQAWHTQPVQAILTDLDTLEIGLTEAEAQARLAQYGPNELPHHPPPTWWQIGLRQFQSPLIYILVIAAVVSLLTGHEEDAIFIGVVLLLNAGIGGYQDWKAEKSSQALQQLLKIQAAVMREGEVVEVDAEQLVPGDVVLLESGSRVPADLRLLQARGLEADESLLTGESLAVVKEAGWLGTAETTLGDRRNMAYAGSTINRGRAKGVVVATAARTAVGQLALDLVTDGGRPPLLVRMERFTHVVAYAVLGAAAVLALLGIFLRGYTVGEMFLFGVALAVSAIPEGLPVALTIALAVATTRMSARKVIVRRLAAVEGLGSCTMIASDKTGTLTCNELTVRTVWLPDGREWQVTGEGYVPEGEVQGADGQAGASATPPELRALARAAVLCNEGDLHQKEGRWVWHGDPTDVALLSFGHKVGLVREVILADYPPLNEIPFEAERRFSATFHQREERGAVFVKGAPERVLGMCGLTAEAREAGLHTAEALAKRGLRLLALAEGQASADLQASDTPAEPSDLTFLGFVGMIDPLRAGVKEAVQQCQAAGIAVCMITGDHPETALAIARELGLATTAEQVVTGQQLEQLSAEERQGAMRHQRVFARITPRQKLDLVEAAQQIGHYVAVTGDGVNDAPALRQANIGVAMGRSGTDVAREAAELVIADDNFATIVAGIEEGRVAYDNVRKVIYLLVSTGAAEVVLLSLAVLTGWPQNSVGESILPLLPVQILWLNLVTNGIQDVALAFEPAEGRVLKRRPRPPHQRIFDRLMVERTLIAAVVMAGVAFGAFYWMVEVAGWSEYTSRNTLLFLMVLFQNIHIANCRSETQSAFSLAPWRSPILLGGVVLAFSIHVLATQWPLLQSVLSVEPISLTTFAVLVGLAMTILVAMEMHKWVWNWRGRDW